MKSIFDNQRLWALEVDIHDSKPKSEVQTEESQDLDALARALSKLEERIDMLRGRCIYSSCTKDPDIVPRLKSLELASKAWKDTNDRITALEEAVANLIKDANRIMTALSKPILPGEGHERLKSLYGDDAHDGD